MQLISSGIFIFHLLENLLNTDIVMGFVSRLWILFYFRAGALQSGQLFYKCLSLVTGGCCDHMDR